VLQQALGPMGSLLHKQACGIDPRRVNRLKKELQIEKSAALPYDTTDEHIINRQLAQITTKLCADLRRSHLLACKLELEVEFADGVTRAAKSTLQTPSDNDSEILPNATTILWQLLTRRTRLRTLTLRLTNTIQFGLQSPMFGEDPQSRQTRLLSALDHIRQRFPGNQSIQFGRTIPAGSFTQTYHDC